MEPINSVYADIIETVQAKHETIRCMVTLLISLSMVPNSFALLTMLTVLPPPSCLFTQVQKKLQKRDLASRQNVKADKVADFTYPTRPMKLTMHCGQVTTKITK